MCRMVRWVAAEPMTVRSLLGDPAIERLRVLTAVHRRDRRGVVGPDRDVVAALERAGCRRDADQLQLCSRRRTRCQVTSDQRPVAETPAAIRTTAARTNEGRVSAPDKGPRVADADTDRTGEAGDASRDMSFDE